MDFAIFAERRSYGIARIDRLENSPQIVITVFTFADDIEEQIDFGGSVFFHFQVLGYRF